MYKENDKIKKVDVKKIIICLAIALFITGCGQTDAYIAKENMAKAADNFEINRRIIFYNTWTDTVVQQIEGKCSIEYESRVSVICKISDTEYVRNFISLSGQVTVFVEQLESVPVNVYHYRRTFKPQSIIPDIDLRVSGKDMADAIIPD